MTASAICIGINYTGKSYALNGCINDCDFIVKLLKENYGYTNIRKMTDSSIGKDRPNRANIIKAIFECKTDVLFISYSGHGVLSKDPSGQDKTGMCQNLYDIDGQNLSDVDLLRCIRDCGAKRVHTIFDCCHSGSMLNLKYRYNFNGRLITTENFYESTGQTVKIVSIQSCEDSEVSAEFSGSGILTMAIAKAVQVSPGITYENVLTSMKNLSRQQHASIAGSTELVLGKTIELN